MNRSELAAEVEVVRQILVERDERLLAFLDEAECSAEQLFRRSRNTSPMTGSLVR